MRLLADGEIVRSMVADVLSGNVSRYELSRRYPFFELLMYDIIIRDRGNIWRSPSYDGDLMG